MILNKFLALDWRGRQEFSYVEVMEPPTREAPPTTAGDQKASMVVSNSMMRKACIQWLWRITKVVTWMNLYDIHAIQPRVIWQWQCIICFCFATHVCHYKGVCMWSLCSPPGEDVVLGWMYHWGVWPGVGVQTHGELGLPEGARWRLRGRWCLWRDRQSTLLHVIALSGMCAFRWIISFEKHVSPAVLGFQLQCQRFCVHFVSSSLKAFLNIRNVKPQGFLPYHGCFEFALASAILVAGKSENSSRFRG